LRGLTTTVTDPTIYALGTLTTAISFAVIGLALLCYFILRRRTVSRVEA
jgi:putative spermidine/putrescine transport system permease protein